MNTNKATAAADGSSIVVLPGEGAGSIAARAGISLVDEIERLNPDHTQMVTLACW